MRVEVEHLPQSQVQLQIEIDPEMLGGAVDKAYQRLAGRYRVPGFRPGKAPRAVLERAIGPELLLSEAADICMNDAYAQAIKENHLHPLGYPDVESPKTDEIDPEKPLSFTAKVYVRPHARLGDYRSLRIAPQVPDVTPEEVDRVLKNVQDEQAPWAPVEDLAAEPGDLATLRILATVDEETLVDQDSWEYRLNVDESPNLPIPGLSRQIIGMRMGDTKDVTIELGEQYSPSEYAGKQMVLHVELLRLDRKVAPELDAAFARTFGNFDTMDELRAALKQSMEAQARNQAMDAYVENVISQVVGQATVEAPPPLIDQEVDDMMRQLQENVERERKISIDNYLRVVGKTMDELRAEARPVAEQRVRTDLVLEEVAEAEGVAAPVAEIDEQVRLVAASPTLSPKERRRLLTSDDLRERVARRLRKRYTINRLLEITRPPEEVRVPENVSAEGSQDAETDGQEVKASQSSQPSTEPAVVTGTQDGTSGQLNEEEN